MRCVVEPGRSLRWYRVAVLATLSVAAVSCSSDTARFSSNPFRSQAQSTRRRERGDRLGRLASIAIRARRCRRRLHPRRRVRSPAPSGSRAHDVTGSACADGRASPAGTGRAAPPSRCAGRNHRRAGDALRRAGRRDREANNIPNGTALQPGQRLVIPKYEVTGRTCRVGLQRAAHAGAGDRGARDQRQPARACRRARRDADALSRQYHKPLRQIAKANNIAPHTR